MDIRGRTFLLLLALTACAKTPASPTPHLVERTAASMGSELQLTAWTVDEPAALAAFNEIFQEFERIEGLFSNWRDHSEVQRLNAAAGEHPVRVGTELRDILATARQVSEWTDGKFDVTFGVMSGLWKFDYQNQDGSIPDPGEIGRRRQLIDYRQL